MQPTFVVRNDGGCADQVFSWRWTAAKIKVRRFNGALVAWEVQFMSPQVLPNGQQGRPHADGVVHRIFQNQWNHGFFGNFGGLVLRGFLAGVAGSAGSSMGARANFS